jgi:hypothetical protein
MDNKMNFENKSINIENVKNLSLSMTSSSSNNEEKKSVTREMNEMYWKNMDVILDKYKKENYHTYLLAQKKGEEIMSFDYNNPEKYLDEVESKEYGKKIIRDITYNGLEENDLDEYDKKCLKIYLGKDDIAYLFENNE